MTYAIKPLENIILNLNKGAFSSAKEAFQFSKHGSLCWMAIRTKYVIIFSFGELCVGKSGLWRDQNLPGYPNYDGEWTKGVTKDDSDQLYFFPTR